jgi:hypothetical protein
VQLPQQCVRGVQAMNRSVNTVDVMAGVPWRLTAEGGTWEGAVRCQPEMGVRDDGVGPVITQCRERR